MLEKKWGITGQWPSKAVSIWLSKLIDSAYDTDNVRNQFNFKKNAHGGS